MTQSQALAIMKTGKNVFLTGEPGSGKTHTAREYVSFLRTRGTDVAVTASTGIAATHMGGMTIHSWSGIGVKDQLSKHDLDAVAKSKHIAKRILRSNVLIIDEISMLQASTLFCVDAVCKKIKQSPLPFGGMQVIFVGDFFQLPPVVRSEVLHNPQRSLIESIPTPRFAYDSPSWKEAALTICYITEQHRQDDIDFLALLTAVRRNALNDSHLHMLASRRITEEKAPLGVPKLFTHNADVDRVNDTILRSLPGTSHVCTMSSYGPDPLVSFLKKSCLSPQELNLKKGAVVMFTKNNQKLGFVNGTLGAVEKIDTVTGYPQVRTRSGKLIDTEPMDWIIEENGETRAKVTQIPLRLAWALTVHKSQGMSLDAAVMDLSGVFEFGQGYVALSRVRRLEGLYLLGWNARAFHVHPAVLAQDAQFREESSRVLHHPVKHLMRGDPIDPPDPAPAHAYRSWDEEQDRELRELYLGGASIGDLSKEFSRTPGSIRSRLKKFNLLET